MKGKILSIVQNSVVIKADVRTDTEGIMGGMNSKGELYTNKYGAFNPNKLLNYEILYNDKSVGKISTIIGRVSDFFLVADIRDKGITSSIVGEDVEILKQNRNRKKQQKWSNQPPYKERDKSRQYGRSR
ncbi:MAG: hypothetical protein CVT89_02510 [Candidatus Altiarchaeales archaeon HGW-Altiarchaeales-2]|nr:MAG: hypothetical protein CVT89_02510 [Candidatus Altiarchaeales archaeon HGW-Altiarchaeales-2]